MNTIFVYLLIIAGDFYKSVELVTLSVTTFVHPYSLFICFIFIFIFIFLLRKKVSQALYLGQAISLTCFQR